MKKNVFVAICLAVAAIIFNSCASTPDSAYTVDTDLIIGKWHSEVTGKSKTSIGEITLNADGTCRFYAITNCKNDQVATAKPDVNVEGTYTVEKNNKGRVTVIAIAQFPAQIGKTHKFRINELSDSKMVLADQVFFGQQGLEYITFSRVKE